jgi:hypothetical protein
LEYNSLLEKEYYGNKVNKEEGNTFLLTPEIYCNSIQKQLFSQLKKRGFFFK